MTSRTTAKGSTLRYSRQEFLVDHRLRPPDPLPAADRRPLPHLNSLTGTVAADSDGSIDLYFGPDPDDDHKSNWIRTVPGKGWFTILRLYGPLDPWFDKTWRPGEIERID